MSNELLDTALPIIGGKEPEDRFAYLHQIADSIQSQQNLEQTLQHILLYIQRLFEVEGTSIALHSPEDKEFYFIRAVEDNQESPPQEREQMRFPDDTGIAGWVFRNESVLLGDTSKDQRYYNKFDKPGAFSAQSMMCVPLRTRKKTLGVMYAMNKLQGQFDLEDLKIFELLATIVSVVIENAELYGELHRHNSSLLTENLRLQHVVQSSFRLDGFIGNSPSIRRLFALIEMVIQSDTTILIQGETGTGKGLLARMIHFNGLRRSRSFIPENCGAITESLLESELFGYTRGAFTGANQDRPGLFQLADGGTLFLDEIGEMSNAMQVKLLRALEDGTIRPVGGKPQQVNVRLIAATHQDLQAKVKEGTFRKDLFYRLHIFPIVLPPLRERIEDIPLLSEHFLRRLAAVKGQMYSVSSAALAALQRYHWPGNIRELENELERATLIAGAAERIELKHLSERFSLDTKSDIFSDLLQQETLSDVVARVEIQMITRVLEETSGNRTEAARRLGITRQGLLSKFKRYKLTV